MKILFILPFFLFAFPTPSCGSYCICKDGVSDQILQKAIDFACGAGADCNPIRANGQCYNPNTVVNHCSYAVNNYFQKKSSTGATCDFDGAAQLTNSPPSGSCLTSGSTASGSSGTGTTPISGGTSGTGGIGVTPTTGTTPTTGSPYSTTTPSSGLGMAPTGSSMDGSGGVVERASLGLILATVLVCGVLCWWN